VNSAINHDRESRHVYRDGSAIELQRNQRGQLSGYGGALSINAAATASKPSVASASV
jgi:hypothetical protein